MAELLILAIDNEDRGRQTLKQWLEHPGRYEVHVADGAESAMQMLSDQVYNLIASDVCLYGDTFDNSSILFFDTLRRRYTSIPVIAITNFLLNPRQASELLTLGPVALFYIPETNVRDFLREVETVLPSEKCCTIMFTDIKGSTGYFSKYSDPSGFSMVQTHNRHLFPIVEAHRGEIIKTIGDSIMADFPTPNDTVIAAIEMQQTINQYNQHQNPDDKIYIRIGINTGYGINFNNDRYGNVVNIAARVEALGDAGDISITKKVFEDLRSNLQQKFHSIGPIEIRGTDREYEIYRANFLIQDS